MTTPWRVRPISPFPPRTPENLKGVDPQRIVRSQQASGKALKDFDRLQMCGGFPWCIASIPIPSWAKTVFPGLPEAEAMEKLWNAIFQAVRIRGDGSAVERWAGASSDAPPAGWTA